MKLRSWSNQPESENEIEEKCLVRIPLVVVVVLFTLVGVSYGTYFHAVFRQFMGVCGAYNAVTFDARIGDLTGYIAVR